MLTVSTSLVLIHGISLHESTKRWDVDSSSHLDYTTGDWGGVLVGEFLVLADVVVGGTGGGVLWECLIGELQTGARPSSES